MDKTNRKDSEMIRKTAEAQNQPITISSGRLIIENKQKPLDFHLKKDEDIAYILIDCSGSMMGEKLNQAKYGALQFAESAINKGYSVGLIQFDTTVKHLCASQRKSNILDEYLQKLYADGSTNMLGAIQMAHNLLKAYEGNRTMVIVTDGMPNDPIYCMKAGANAPIAAIDIIAKCLHEADMAKRDGIDIITIGTDDADQYFLKKLASKVEMGSRVKSENLGKAIASAANLLPSPKNK